MKSLKFLTIALMLLTATTVHAQVVSKTSAATEASKRQAAAVSSRQQSFYEVEEPSDADLQWMKIVYRELDLTKGKNSALYYPEEPNEDGESMFYIIMRLVAGGDVPCYEWLDGREMFTDEYQYKVSTMLDRFHILFTEAKGSTAAHPRYAIDNSDIPGNEVLSYYIIEKWQFDTRSNKMRSRVEALCPVLHREDEYGVTQRWPMFWVKLNDIRPYIAKQFVFTDNDNNLLRYNLDDFFKLNQYSGEIYKVKNLRNQTLRQQFPDDSAYHHAQDSIEQRLRRFDQQLWVPDREEILAAKQKAQEAEQKANATDAEETAAEGNEDAADEQQAEQKSVRKSSSKRGSTTKSTSKSSKKKTKVKTRKAKSSSSSSTVRSVRNRKR